MQNNSSNKFSLIDCVALFPVFILLFFYSSYALNAWFYQDDFGFIARYSGYLALHELRDFSNFGRFISRNLYWFLGTLAFGKHAIYYFAVNFFTIFLCCALIFRFIAFEHNARTALISAFLYFSYQGVITAYAWISNSQHFLGHLGVFLFIFYYLKSIKNNFSMLSAKQSAALLSIVIIGILCNIFMALTLSLPAWYMLTNLKSRKDRFHWILMILGTLAFLYALMKLKSSSVQDYAMAFDWKTFKINIKFYFGGVSLFGFYLLTVIGGAFLYWRANSLFQAWLLLASALFFLPFAFLMHQRYAQYITLSHVFFFLALLTQFFDWLRLKQVKPDNIRIITAVITILALSFSLKPLRFFTENPRGADQKYLIDQLKIFDTYNGAKIQHYCFSPRHLKQNDTGVKVWDIPPEWWFVGFGKAFTLYVNASKTYELLHEAKICDVHFAIDEKALTLKP